MKEKIVIADDERGLADTLSYAFTREGYEVFTAYDGRRALEMIQEIQPKIAILDVTMPYLSGFEVLKQINPSQKIGVILLTAKNDLVDKVLGLEFGADDYITKPFDMREVLARASALLRRMDKFSESPGAEASGNTIQSGPLSLQLDARMALLEGVELELTPKEFDLLWIFAGAPMRVFTREQLLEMIWDLSYEGGTRTVDIHVQRLRKKLGCLGETQIQTVYKVGYKWVGDGLVPSR